METNDNTILEMQRQMEQLREKLDSQKIVNERILRNSFGQNARRLRVKSSVPIIAGTAAILSTPALYNLGMSVPFLIFSGVLMAVCVVATILVRSLIPDMNKDLVTATRDLVRFRKIQKDWIKFGIPALVVWLVLFVLDLWKHSGMFEEGLAVPMISGILIGAVIGVAVGVKNRRDVLDASGDLLSQIEELNSK